MHKILDEPNRFIVIVLGILTGVTILLSSDYYLYYLPVITILFLLTIFFEKVKKDVHLVIWSIVFFTPFLGSQRSTEEIILQQIDPIRILRVGLLISLTSLLVLRMFIHKFKGIADSLKGPLGWYLIYAFIAMISSTYSAQPLVSLWKGFEVFAMIIVAMFIYEKLRNYEEMKRFWNLNIMFIVLLVGSAYVSAMISPSEAFVEVKNVNFRQLYGVYPHINSNSLTQMAAIVIVIYIVRHFFSVKNRVNLAFIALAIPVLVLSYGRTSILALFVTMFIVLMLMKKYRYLFFLGFIALLVFWIDGYSYIQIFFEKGGSFYTLTGRLHTWTETWKIVNESPLFGYGFYVASRVLIGQMLNSENFLTTDNTYLDVLISVGVIGLIPFILIVYTHIKKIISNLRYARDINSQKLNLEILCVTFIILIRALTGPSFQMLHWNLSIFLTVIVIAMFLGESEQIKYEGRKDTPP